MTPDEARKRVKECTGDTLSFHDVETLEEDTAEELAKFKGDWWRLKTTRFSVILMERPMK